MGGFSPLIEMCSNILLNMYNYWYCVFGAVNVK